MKTEKPIKVIIVGAGCRGICYSNYAARFPERMKIVGVAEPRNHYRKVMAEKKPTTAKTPKRRAATAKSSAGKAAAAVASVEASDILLSSTVRRQAIFWLVSLAAFVLVLILLRSILLPFVAGMALAYFLDPVADRLEKLGISRVIATTVILLVFLIVFIVAVLRIVPVLSSQLSSFLEKVPGYVTSLQAVLANSDFLNSIIGEDGNNIRENLDKVLGKGAEWTSTVLGSIWSSGVVILDIVSLMVITPIIRKISEKNVPSLLGGLSLVAIFFGLLITQPFVAGFTIGGTANLLAATLLVWLGALIAGILVPKYLFTSLNAPKS